LYFEREVHPHVPDAWMDRSKDKVGYEMNWFLKMNIGASTAVSAGAY